MGCVGKHVNRRTHGWINILTTTSIGNEVVDVWSSIKNLKEKEFLILLWSI
jgi:hypothetical protein